MSLCTTKSFERSCKTFVTFTVFKKLHRKHVTLLSIVDSPKIDTDDMPLAFRGELTIILGVSFVKISFQTTAQAQHFIIAHSSPNLLFSWASL